MGKYRVTLHRYDVTETTILIEANSAEEAGQKAASGADAGRFDNYEWKTIADRSNAGEAVPQGVVEVGECHCQP